MRCSRSTVKWSRVSSTCVCCVLPNCCAVHVTDSIYMNYFMSTSGETLRYNMTFKPIKWFIAENWETTTKRQRYTHTHLLWTSTRYIIMCFYACQKRVLAPRLCWLKIAGLPERPSNRTRRHTHKHRHKFRAFNSQPTQSRCDLCFALVYSLWFFITWREQICITNK